MLQSFASSTLKFFLSLKVFQVFIIERVYHFELILIWLKIRFLIKNVCSLKKVHKLNLSHSQVTLPTFFWESLGHKNKFIKFIIFYFKTKLNTLFWY